MQLGLEKEEKEYNMVIWLMEKYINVNITKLSIQVEHEKGIWEEVRIYFTKRKI